MATEAEAGTLATNFIDLPDDILTLILCILSLESLSAASKSCSSLHRIINSANFHKAYAPQHSWIVVDSAGAEYEPALLFYNTLSNVWRPMPIPDICGDHALLNPRMISASGGLILFLAVIKSTCFEHVLVSDTICQDRQQLKGPELVVVNPLTRKSRRLPNPPVLLNCGNLCIEMVTLEASYKVILFTTRMLTSFFVYNSGVQKWKRVDVAGPLIPSGSGAVYRSSGVVYKSVLCWLITADSSYLVFFDIQTDRVKRKTVCFPERVYGIGVRRLGIVGVTTEGLCRLDLRRDRWVKLSTTGGLNMNMNTNMGVVCGSEEEDVVWFLSLHNGGRQINCKFRGCTLLRHMDLISYEFCNTRWRQLCPCFIQLAHDVPKPNPRSISQAKWTKWRFEASP